MKTRLVSLCAAALSVLFSLPLFAGTRVQIHPPRDAEFFTITSIDSAKQELVLKSLTEFTQVAKVTNHTPYLDAEGNELRFTDLQTGDTVYVILSRDVDGVPRILSLHRGPFAADELPLHLGK